MNKGIFSWSGTKKSFDAIQKLQNDLDQPKDNTDLFLEAHQFITRQIANLSDEAHDDAIELEIEKELEDRHGINDSDDDQLIGDPTEVIPDNQDKTPTE